MRIVYLIDRPNQLWGGVKSVLADAAQLSARGHDVTVVGNAEPPAWMSVDCAFRRHDQLTPAVVPDAELVVASDCSTALVAAECAGAVAVHYVQGWEGAHPQWQDQLDKIDHVYGLPTHKVTISEHLRSVIESRYAQTAHLVTYAIDHEVMYPGPTRPRVPPVRVGLVGPYDVPTKDIRTGLEACSLAARAGLDLALVRVSNTAIHPEERQVPFPVEWHERVDPARMGDIYRSLDIMLGTSCNEAEGFFLPAVEAMACGIPCVLTEIPCHLGYGDGQYALFVEPRSPAQLAEAIVVTAGHPNVADELRRQGIETARRYNCGDHIVELERTFESILEATGAARMRTTAPASAVTPQEVTHSAIECLKCAADLYLEDERYDDAARHLEAAAAIAGDDLDVIQRLAHARYLAGDDRGALEQYERLIELGSERAEVFANRGLILFGLERPDDARSSFERASALAPSCAETHNNLGVSRYRCGDVDGARSAFERALQLEPQHADAASNLERLLS